MTKQKLLALLLLIPLLLAGCGSTDVPNIEADEAMPQLMDEGSASEFEDD